MQNILSHPPTIETERLILRPLAMADDEAIYSYASDPQVAKYVSFDTATNIEDTRIFLRSVLENYSKGAEPAGLGIVLKKENKLIGTIGHLNWNDDHRRIEIGYALSRPFWNNGYVTEAAIRLIDYFFSNTNIMRIEARCRLPNLASARVMEKAGMTFEGILRNHLFMKGENHDIKMYSIIRDEWKRQNNN
jgi:ribosomal-protein-alanine N-acetyltransferase